MRKPTQYIEIFLQPGEWYFGDADTRIRTLLGSCVAITMWHPRRRLGGMCHYLLPTRAPAQPDTLDGRYGDEALRILLQEVARHNTLLEEYDLKLFGGGHMWPELARPGRKQIGVQNILVAQQLLASLRVPVTAQHVGESGHRNIIFDVWSGRVWVKYQPITLDNARPTTRKGTL
jgi:chemotaxis protein CheD